MNKGNFFTVPFRRKREGRTYYKKRLKILGSSKCRFVVRRSLRNIQVSLVQFDMKGDKVLVTVNSRSLGKLGWKGDNGNLPSAYLTGMLAAKKAAQKGIKDAILDIGFSNSTKGNRIYAALAGAKDAGLNIPCDKEILPKEDRFNGSHISKYAQSMKGKKEQYEKHFSLYLKKGLHPEDLTKHFNEIKGKING